MKALNKAILERARGDEVLTPGSRALQAQTDFAALVGTVRTKPDIQEGPLPSSVAYEGVRFHEAGGPRAIEGEGIGDILNNIYHFEAFTQKRDSTTLRDILDCIDLMFNERRDAPALTIEGDDRIYSADLFTGFQGPFPDTERDCFYATIALRFVEARP